MVTCDFPCYPLARGGFAHRRGAHFHEPLGHRGRLTGNRSTSLLSFVPHSMTAEETARLDTTTAMRLLGRPSHVLRRPLAIGSVEDATSAADQESGP